MIPDSDQLTHTATRVISRDDHATVLQIQKARIEVVEGKDQGRKSKVPGHGLTVGSATECGLVLDDSAVSRRHCTLTPTERGFVLRDLDSKNGIQVAGIEVVEAVLHGGEEIVVGHSRLRFSVLDEHEEFVLSDSTSFGALMGRSAAMRQIFAVLERAAESDSTLLLEGESGTGKDLAAETIHGFSQRRDGPLVIVDAGSIQANLAESELFGHRKGAFTGADRDREGAFESGRGGTVFLDEVGELDLSLQPRLLRLLEKREVKRLGENHYRPTDVRLIAATNRDLQAEVAAGRFREDLFYRLSVIGLRMPALREHKEDIGMLAKHFVQQLAPRLDPDEIITAQVLAVLISHDWPGNVRELRNVVERLLLFPDRPRSALAQSGLARDDNEPFDIPFHEARRKWTERFEKIYLNHLLESCAGVVSNAADKAGISRQTFHRLMNKLGLTKE